MTWIRVRRFIETAWWMWQQRLLSRHNLRAAWIQSDPDWQKKMSKLELSDEEWDKFEEELRKL